MNQKLNTLEIKEALFLERYLNKKFARFEFFIDGKRLYSQLRKVSDYGDNRFGVLAESNKFQNIEYYYALLDMFLGKEPKEVEHSYALELFKQNRIALYECGDCAYLDCGTFTAELIINDDTVTWQNFEFFTDYHIAKNDFKDFHFVFDRKQYEKVFNDLYKC